MLSNLGSYVPLTLSAVVPAAFQMAYMAPDYQDAEDLFHQTDLYAFYPPMGCFFGVLHG